MTNKEIERKAIKEVIKYEKQKKRKPEIVPQGNGYDIKSSGRCIEVKGCKKEVRGWRMFEHNCFEALQKAKRYFVYIVEKLETHKPELYIIPCSAIIRHLKLKPVWQINLPVKEMRKWRRPLNHDNTRGRE